MLFLHRRWTKGEPKIIMSLLSILVASKDESTGSEPWLRMGN
jgi:hypothetical protein